MVNMRGQYSIEALLILVLVVAASAFFVPKIAEQVEINQVMSAARIGAEEAISMISLDVQTNSSFDPPYSSMIKIVSIELNEKSPNFYVSKLTVTVPAFYDKLNNTQKGQAVSMINSKMTQHVVNTINREMPSPSTRTVTGITYNYYLVNGTFNRYAFSAIRLQGITTFNISG